MQITPPEWNNTVENGEDDACPNRCHYTVSYRQLTPLFSSPYTSSFSLSFLISFYVSSLSALGWRKKAIDPSFRFLDERKVRQVWKELGGQVRKEALRDEESKKHSRLWDSITTSRVIYIDIQVARVVSLYVSSLFSTLSSLSLSLLPGAFTPCKNESNNYRALCLTRNFHPCRSS